MLSSRFSRPGAVEKAVADRGQVRITASDASSGTWYSSDGCKKYDQDCRPTSHEASA